MRGFQQIADTADKVFDWRTVSADFAETAGAVRFWQEFPHRGVGWDFCILRNVIPERSIIMFFFVVFELALDC